MAPNSSIKLSYPEKDIARLTFDLPDKGANILSHPVMEELAGHLDELAKRDDIVGVILDSAKPSIFIAGADIREFAASMEVDTKRTYEMCRWGQTLFGRLHTNKWITVAAINGTCVGGGTELALGCDRRVVTTHDKTEIGLPEVKLGIYPGWGGTVRLSRLVGLGNAVKMITSGESVSPQKALELGFADDMVPPEHLLAAAIGIIREEEKTGQYKQDRAKRVQPISINETEFGFMGATASAYIQQQTKGQYPAPLAALETLLGGAMLDAEAALELEAQGMASLFGTPVNAALINVFLLTDRNKKDSGVAGDGPQPRKLQSASVIGAGIMGSGIAAANLKRGLAVKLNDANAEALQRGASAILDEVSFDKATRSKSVERAIEYAGRLRSTTNSSELLDSDIIIEAVVENLELKRKIFAGLEENLPETTILASNTSTLPITKLAGNLKHPERFVGIHFFNPVRKMKLVEVIRGEKTSDETAATAVAYAKGLGKFPIVVNDGPGFLVNRLLFPYMNEATQLLQDGVDMKRIDKVAVKFGMPMGPIALYDMVGIDTSFYAGRTMYDAFPDRTLVSPILPALIKNERLGTKKGYGFYNHEKKKGRPEPDPMALELIARYVDPPQREITDAEIEHRLILPMLLEATRALDEGVVRDPRDVDLGLIFGIGFPPFKGGLLFWADTVGAKTLVEWLKPLEEIGKRFVPTEMLLDMAKNDSKFYDRASN
ncbi:3-hydroxyacyl-CoA dehydrogenase NAD-binding domain-containing protein [Bremerella sp. JC817]|uniref:3-hydroxyacyl-CoA dehydrogenase NAD-binding domain-containing protein n=1 Tax=Bremerella sp. JC817 TaxID=3231756 RepID=UPI0034581DA0